MNNPKSRAHSRKGLSGQALIDEMDRLSTLPNPHKLKRETIRGRLRRGWSEDEVLNTPVVTKAVSHRSDHPFKNQSYFRMLKRKEEKK